MQFSDIVANATFALFVLIPIAIVIIFLAGGRAAGVGEILGKIAVTGISLLAAVALGWPIVWFISLFIPGAPSNDMFMGYIYCMLIGFISLCIIAIVGAVALVVALIVYMIWSAIGVWFRY